MSSKHLKPNTASLPQYSCKQNYTSAAKPKWTLNIHWAKQGGWEMAGSHYLISIHSVRTWVQMFAIPKSRVVFRENNTIKLITGKLKKLVKKPDTAWIRKCFMNYYGNVTVQTRNNTQHEWGSHSISLCDGHITLHQLTIRGKLPSNVIWDLGWFYWYVWRY